MGQKLGAEGGGLGGANRAGSPVVGGLCLLMSL